MQTGVIGLGKMGFNLALRMKNKGHDVVAFDVNEDALQAIAKEGIATVRTLKDFAESLSSKRVIWMMLETDALIEEILDGLKFYLSISDIVIDASPSFYKDTMRRAFELQGLQIDYLDCGLSEGVEGALHGICATIGGSRFAFHYCEPLFKDIAVHGAYAYCGRSGSGHFAEYVYHHITGHVSASVRESIASIPPGEFNVDIEKLLQVWRHGNSARKALATRADLSMQPKT